MEDQLGKQMSLSLFAPSLNLTSILSCRILRVGDIVTVFIRDSRLTRTPLGGLPSFEMIRSIGRTSGQGDFWRLWKEHEQVDGVRGSTYKVVRETILVVIKVTRKTSLSIHTDRVPHVILAVMRTDVGLIDRAPHVKRVSVISRDEDQGIFIFSIFLCHIRCQSGQVYKNDLHLPWATGLCSWSSRPVQWVQPRHGGNQRCVAVKTDESLSTC